MRHLYCLIEKCLGCKSCEIACAVAHSKSKRLFEAIKEKPLPQQRVRVEAGEGLAIPMQCRHCDDAPCVSVCPSNALSRADAETPVLFDRDRCIGCKACILICPFGVIFEDRQGKAIIKCDQCIERLESGKEPACVEACPTGALVFKTMDEKTRSVRKKVMDNVLAIMKESEKTW